MLKALVDDKKDFVRLFLDKGVTLEEFLTDERQWALYKNVGDVLAHARTHTRTHIHTIARARAPFLWYTKTNCHYFFRNCEPAWPCGKALGS